MNNRIAVLILNYNSQIYLKGCLDSIKQQTYKNFDTYFIDNNSEDKSVDFVKKYYKKIKIIKHPNNYGVGKGFNLVIKKLINQYDYFILLNPDVILTPNYIKHSNISFQKDPSIDIVACNSIFNHNHLIDNIGGIIINLFFGIFGGQFNSCKFSKIPKYYKTNPSPIFYALITGMMIKKSTLIKYGFFDEDYFIYFEDIDLSWRIQLGGGKIVANPKAILYHIGHGSVKNISIQYKLLGLIENNLLSTYYKNLSLSGILFILPLTTLSRLFMSFFYLPISPKITIIKIKYILLFIINLFTNPKKRLKREKTQNLRLLNDLEIFKKNPNSVLSIKLITSSFYKWFSFIKLSNQKLSKI